MHGRFCSSNCATTLLLIHGRPASIDGCRLVSMSHRLSVTMFRRVDVDSFWPCAAVVIDANHDEGRHQPGKPNPSADHRTSPIAKRPSAASVSVKIRPAAPPSISSSSTSQKNSDTGPAVKTSAFIKKRYVKTGAVGIRERGGRQVMQILPVNEYSYSGEHMKTIDSWADTCISKLERGESIDDVKKWVVKQKKPLLDAVAAARSALGNALVNGQAD